MAKLKIQKHKAVHPRVIDEVMIRLADDLVKSICDCSPDWMRHPTQHMRNAIYAYSDYRKELIG